LDTSGQASPGALGHSAANGVVASITEFELLGNVAVDAAAFRLARSFRLAGLRPLMPCTGHTDTRKHVAIQEAAIAAVTPSGRWFAIAVGPSQGSSGPSNPARLVLSPSHRPCLQAELWWSTQFLGPRHHTPADEGQSVPGMPSCIFSRSDVVPA
jgi:hypothetical protein